MGTTSENLWYPDPGTPVAGLHTLLAQMQNSVDSALVAHRAERTAGYPKLSMVSSGSAEGLPANTLDYIGGGNSGWAVAASSAASAAAGMQSHTGLTNTPITLTQAGTYSIRVNIVHSPNSGSDFGQQCFTDLLVSGTAGTLTYRTVWSFSTIASDTHKVDVPAGVNDLSLVTFAAAAGIYVRSELTVWKEK